jgi:hypothetical protein
MRLRKLGHACERLEQAGVTLVIDPGSFSAPDALDGANAVLITAVCAWRPTPPEQPVDTLLLPVYAPWCKISKVIDFVRAVKPRLAVPIHDALLSDYGLALVDHLLGPQGPGIGTNYRRLGPTDWLDLPAPA